MTTLDRLFYSLHAELEDSMVTRDVEIDIRRQRITYTYKKKPGTIEMKDGALELKFNNKQCRVKSYNDVAKAMK